MMMSQLSQSQSRFEFSLALTGSDVEPYLDGVNSPNQFIPRIWDNYRNNILPMAIGVNLGADFAIVQNKWLSIHTGLKYSLVGSKVDARIGSFGEEINKSIYNHYAQVPLKITLEKMNPFYFYAGASFNYALHFDKDFEKLYGGNQIRQDWRYMTGLGWRLNHYSVFAQFEESLMDFGNKKLMNNQNWSKPKNTIISLGLTVNMDGLKKESVVVKESK